MDNVIPSEFRHRSPWVESVLAARHNDVAVYEMAAARASLTALPAVSTARLMVDGAGVVPMEREDANDLVSVWNSSSQGAQLHTTPSQNPDWVFVGVKPRTPPPPPTWLAWGGRWLGWGR